MLFRYMAACAAIAIVFTNLDASAVDFDAYCKKFDGSKTRAVLQAPLDPNSWICDGPHGKSKIDIQNLCTRQAGSNTKAVLRKPTDPNSWYCKTVSSCSTRVLRACHDLCDATYGSFCMFGDVCNPDTHNCEHAQP